MFTCLLLTAGMSTRFGSMKALAKLNNETAIEHTQNILLQAQIGEIIVVLGANAEAINPWILQHKKIKVVYNKYYNLGQTSSFQAGIKTADCSVKGYLLLPIDVPFLKLSTIDNLIYIFGECKKRVLVPSFAGKKGHPPIFDQSLKQEILALPHQKGINTILHRHDESNDTATIDVDDPGVTAAFNTVEEFNALKTQFNYR